VSSTPTSNEVLLDELLHPPSERSSTEAGKRKRKMSVLERLQGQGGKRAMTEDTEEANSHSASVSVASMLARAEEVRERARGMKESEPETAIALYQEALALLSPLPRSAPSLPSARDFKAGVLYALGVLNDRQLRREEAKGFVLQALEWKKDWAKAWRGLGLIEHNLRHFPQAVEAFDRALQCPMDENERT
jgi:tetratricopeptide (TPR) repeat protein